MKWANRESLAAVLAWLALLSVAGVAHAQDTAVVKRATALRDSPADAGATVAPLEANTVVTRSSERKGPWTRVSTAQGATGWVHMFDLGPASGSATGAATSVGSAASGGLRGLGSLLGVNSTPTSTATSTVGIRGLGAEDIANAQPNPAAVSQAEALRIDANQARQFAATASLQPQTVPPLAEPARPASAGSSGSGGSSNNPADPNFSAN